MSGPRETLEALGVPFEGAEAVIRARVAPLLAGGRRAVVGIGGPVASGKSTLARRVSSCVVSTDDYLPDYDTVACEERDMPERAHLGELAGHLGVLRERGRALVPAWSFQTHRREGEREVVAGALIVCEGIHALHAEVRGAMDVLVYVHAERAERLARFEARELAGERGWTVVQAREHFEGVAEPTFDARAWEYLRAADVVVVNRWRGVRR